MIISPLKPYSPNQYQLGEGLFSDKNTILAVDIKQNKIIRLSSAEVSEKIFPYSNPSCVIPIDGQQYLVAAGQSIYQWVEGQTIELCHLQNVDPQVRFNDAKCDARGTLWIGTLDQGNRSGLGGLYRLNHIDDQYQLEKVLNADLSNGLGWNTDSTCFYYIDTPTKSLQVFEYYLPTSQIGNRIRQIDLTISDIPNAVPDGMTVDTENHIWIAIWNGFRILRLNPITSEIQEYPINSRQPTTVVIDKSQYIYVSTANDYIYRGKISNDHLTSQPCNYFKLI